MATRPFYHSLVILLSVTAVIISACGTGSDVAGRMPPAETPILETILDLDSKTLVPFHAFGVFEMPPNKRIELRLRALELSTIEVRVEGQTLAKVTDDANHPELESPGYYKIYEVVPVSNNDPRAFWKVRVVLPESKQGVNFEMTIHDFSLNPNLSGVEKEAPALRIGFSRVGVGIPRPSSVFWQHPGCLDEAARPPGDCKHAKFDDPPDHDGAFIADNVTIAGWLMDTPRPCCDDGIEDIHYHIWIDNDFIERNYSPFTQPLADAVMPGRWITWLDDLLFPRKKIPLTGGNQPNVGTFILPGLDSISVELNAWHKSRHDGQIPPSWVSQPDFTDYNEYGKALDRHFKGDVYWPFVVTKPSGAALSEPDLQEGEYVIITGALVEDTAHLPRGGSVSNAEDWVHKCWNEHYQGHGGWLEIHPVDSIRRVPAPMLRKQPQLVQVCDNEDDHSSRFGDFTLAPWPSDPPSPNSVLRFREIIDDRFTDKVLQHTAEINQYNPTQLLVHVTLNTRGTFKAIYLLWWEEGDGLRPTPIQHPTGIAIPTIPPICQYKPEQCDLQFPP